MITYKPMGRMGNALFQVATIYAYALDYDLEFTVPFETSNKIWSPIYFTHLQSKNYDRNKKTVIIKEQQFHHYELPYYDYMKDCNVVFEGYFQSYKRFEHRRKEILSALNLPYELKKDTVSIHARYGDYLTIKGKHIIIDEDYLKKAMALITEKTGITKFKVFSDDLDLFKQRHGDLYDFEYSTNKNEMEDLIGISCCHSQINSSSTFSWWGAWLNQNPDKIVTTQSRWFQNGWKETNREVLTDDLIPLNWIKL